jgi:hypothetical protein
VITDASGGLFHEDGKIKLKDLFRRHCFCYNGFWTVSKDFNPAETAEGPMLYEGEILCSVMDMKGKHIWTLRQWQGMGASSRKKVLSDGVQLRVLTIDKSAHLAERRKQAVRRGKDAKKVLPGIVDERGVPQATATTESNQLGKP